MAIRLRKTPDGDYVALCAAEHIGLPGDTYLHDGFHHALYVKFAADRVLEDGGGAAQVTPRGRSWAPTDYESFCQSASDGDCDWPHCPQNRDGEPDKSGRHCPLDGPLSKVAAGVMVTPREDELRELAVALCETRAQIQGHPAREHDKSVQEFGACAICYTHAQWLWPCLDHPGTKVVSNGVVPTPRGSTTPSVEAQREAAQPDPDSLGRDDVTRARESWKKKVDA